METSQSSNAALVEELRKALVDEFFTPIRAELRQLKIGLIDLRTQAKTDMADLRMQLTELRGEIESLRDFQIAQDRERHSLLLSAHFAGRGRLPPRVSNYVDPGTHFLHKSKRDRPASIY